MNTKKNSKILALLLALAMVFVMSVPAFADTTNHTANVSVQLYGENAYSRNVSTSDINALTNSGGHIYSISSMPAGVPNIGLTAADALFCAYLNQYGTSQLDAEAVDYAWNPTPEIGAPGMYVTMFEGLASDAGSYYYVGTKIENNKTVYEYYWRGDTWNLYVNGNLATSYITSYAFNNITSLVFDYNTTRSENFTMETYMPAPPASEDPYN